MSNQSAELSFHCSELVKVLYEDKSWNTRSTTANLEQISAGSATLLAGEHPPVWRPIAFSLKGHDLYGIVESLDVDPVLGCFIRVKLDAKHRWRKELVVPDHFLDLSQPERHAGFRNAA